MVGTHGRFVTGDTRMRGRKRLTLRAPDNRNERNAHEDKQKGKAEGFNHNSFSLIF
jgi:hypothetical protein